MSDSVPIDLALAPTLPPSIPRPPPDAPFPDGDGVPGYEIIAELGRGGMGVVYKARHLALDRIVALKMILTGGHASAADRERFRAEGLAVARLQHPNIVQIHEVGEYRGRPYFSLEYCPGGGLDAHLVGTPQPPAESAALVETIARAVQHAHDHGFIHRDLKPANVLLSERSADSADDAVVGTRSSGSAPAAKALGRFVPKITDFGLAKSLDGSAGRTVSGAIIGTPSYMAPEQASGSREHGPRTDVYALGAILYELLTGRPPFRAATALDTVLQVVSDDPVPPTRLQPTTPRDLDTICLKCLSKDPARRYASAAALTDDLRRFQTGEPIAARPVSTIERIVKWSRRRPAVAALSAFSIFAMAGGFAGVFWQLRIANEARSRAESQEGLANQRADELSRQQARILRELHQSDLLRADVLLKSRDYDKCEELLWRAHFTRPDDDDTRARWRLWDLYRARPRRSGWWMGLQTEKTLVRFASNGQKLVVTRDKEVTVHDTATGAVLAKFATAQGGLAQAAFSPDSRSLGLLSSLDGSIAIWEVEPRPRLKATLTPGKPPPADPMRLLGGNLIGISAKDMEAISATQANSLTSFCILSADRVLMCDSTEATLWSVNGPTIISRFELESLPPFPGAGVFGTQLSAAESGELALAGRGGQTELWKLPPGAGGAIGRTGLDFSDPATFRRKLPDDQPRKPKKPGEWFADAITQIVVLSPNGQWLITRDAKKIRTWDVATGKKLGETADDPAGATYSFSFSPDGALLKGHGSTSRVWRLPHLEPVAANENLPHSFARGSVFSADGRQSYAVGAGFVGVYEHEPTAVSMTYQPPDQLGKGLNPRHELGASGPVATWDFKHLSVWHDGPMRQLTHLSAWEPDISSALILNRVGTIGVGLSSGFFGTKLTVYDLAKPSVAGTIRLRKSDGSMVRITDGQAISPDSRRIAVTTADCLYLVELAPPFEITGRIPNEAANMRFTGNPVWSPDGLKLAVRQMSNPYSAEVRTKGFEQRLAVLDARDDRVIARSEADSTQESILGFTPDGAMLVSHRAGTLRFRNATTLAQLASFEAGIGFADCAAFAPDGRILAIGGDKLRLWDLVRREEIIALDFGDLRFQKLVFTPVGRKLRFVGNTSVGEIDLQAFDPHIAGNRGWNLERLIPNLHKSGGRAEIERILERIRTSDADAHRRGRAAVDALGQ